MTHSWEDDYYIGAPVFDLYLARAKRSAIINSWRPGQALFNVLTDMKPELMNEVVGTDIDPYYDDSLIPEFLKWLEDRWEE